MLGGPAGEAKNLRFMTSGKERFFGLKTGPQNDRAPLWRVWQGTIMLSDLWIRVRAVVRRRAVESELAEELRFHVEEQAKKYEAQGLTREEAKRRARLEFGGAESLKEECREARGGEYDRGPDYGPTICVPNVWEAFVVRLGYHTLFSTWNRR